MTMRKYRNIKSGGFDSRKEARRWAELNILQRAGKITDLERQIRIELIPEQRDAAGKLQERACCYIADFRYREYGQTVIEDTKGFKTPEYIIKRKLALWVHGISIREV